MNDLLIRRFDSLQDYETIWTAMRQFTTNRNVATADEIWLLQHFPVFTLGQGGKKEHLLEQNTIPLIKSDRGGQITYHGPGQLVAYVLLDLKRRHLSVRDLVSVLETSLIQVLASFNIDSYAKKSAPGVYVIHQNGEHKIAALGLRVHKGFSYHGLSLNIDMDMVPFSQINPCGYSGLKVTQMKDLLRLLPEKADIENKLIQLLEKHLH